jgi:hypothetical protein
MQQQSLFNTLSVITALLLNSHRCNVVSRQTHPNGWRSVFSRKCRPIRGDRGLHFEGLLPSIFSGFICGCYIDFSSSLCCRGIRVSFNFVVLFLFIRGRTLKVDNEDLTDESRFFFRRLYFLF